MSFGSRGTALCRIFIVSTFRAAASLVGSVGSFVAFLNDDALEVDDDDILARSARAFKFFAEAVASEVEGTGVQLWVVG